MLSALHAVLKSLAIHALVKGAIALALHLASLAHAQTLLAYEQGAPNLYRVDAATGAATLVGTTQGLPGNIVSLDARGHQLLAIALSGPQGARQSHLVEIDPCTGALIAAHAVTLDGAAPPGFVEALAHDGAGNLVASYSPGQQGVSNVLALLGDDGALTPHETYSGAFDDFDGLCPIIIDSGSNGNVTYAGYLAMNRDPDTGAAHLLRIDDGAEGTTLLQSYPFSPDLDGLNDITLFSGVLYGADSVYARIYRFEPGSGAILGHATLSPAVALSAVTPFSPVVITTQPRSVNACITSDAAFSVVAASTAPLSYEWQLESSRGAWHTLTTANRPLPGGGTVSATTPDAASTTISIRGRTGRVMVRVVVTGACDTVTSYLASVFINSADFDNDGDAATDADIEAFFACIAGTCPSTGGSADFDADGDSATDADIESFFRVLAGGPC